jgi:alpha-1,2-mannosyltransferase
MYNVFSGSERGPNIFGTEPWDFYIRNLLLNFNVWFLLALIAGPLLGLNFLVHNKSTSKRFSIRYLWFIIPFYLWLTIFTLQPHKEERFMYPAYPLLCLNASIATHVILSYIGASGSSKIMRKISGQLKLAFVGAFFLSATVAGVLRIIGVVSAYQAPLQVYSPLGRFPKAMSDETVCLGKEWYRFPSSYFLPSGMRAKFVKSAFDGLLPGEFNEAKVGFGLFPGTWLDPPGMNDLNIEDPGKYVGVLIGLSSNSHLRC